MGGGATKAEKPQRRLAAIEQVMPDGDGQAQRALWREIPHLITYSVGLSTRHFCRGD